MPTVQSQGPASAFDRIVDYYEQTWFDYRAVWLDRENQAFHFGYWDDEVSSHADALLNSNRVLASLAGVKPGQRILDAGCAHGGSACWLAKEHDVEVVGITLVDRQVQAARRAASERGLSNKVEFQNADYCNTGFADGSFDVVWALESLCHASRKADFYAEAARLLKPGGRLIVADYMRAARPLSERLERTCKEWLNGWAIDDIDTPEEHTANALGAGFEAVVVRDMTQATRRSLRRLHRLSLLVWYPDMALSKIGVRSPTQRGNVVASRRQWQALRSQAWRYGVLSATRSDVQV
ncbi:MAG: cyclopropane-fatty-acyl-phospholipid synthase family protein [Myxococcota bacterium]